MNEELMAFPQFEKIGDISHAYGGMTLRDYFAAKAMQGELSSQMPDHEWSDLNYLAKYSYTVADAMLKAREQAKC